MCKIATFSNSTKLDIRKASEVIGKILLAQERDGFGYAVQGSTNVFGEKCTADFFTSRLNVTHAVKLPIIEVRQSTFGHTDKPTGPAMFHGRTSTNDRGLVNCHPMHKESWHLIHNGVVTDHGEKYVKNTTNDSEDLLHRLILGMGDVEKHLSGYYAFTAIDPQGRLHVGRDSIATLYMAWLPKIESYLFCTTVELLESVCKALSIKYGPIDKVQDNSYFILNGNDLAFTSTISPRGYDSYSKSMASLSLGRDLESYSTAFPEDGNLSPDTQDIDALLEELDAIDDSYRIQDGTGEPITSETFKHLDDISRLDCLIQRPDGSRVDMALLIEWMDVI
jgi:hypothetical protein